MKDIDAKWHCEECGAVNVGFLEAPNPFSDDLLITGCKGCCAVGTLHLVCDEPGCTKLVSCGTPVAGSEYRRTCSDHRPAKK